MPDKTHWPFTGDTESGDSDHSIKNQSKLDSQNARAANQAAFQQRMRNDRLLVGGRAHVRKSGLS
jgi:hypothetical protein